MKHMSMWFVLKTLGYIEQCSLEQRVSLVV